MLFFFYFCFGYAFFLLSSMQFIWDLCFCMHFHYAWNEWQSKQTTKISTQIKKSNWFCWAHITLNLLLLLWICAVLSCVCALCQGAHGLCEYQFCFSFMAKIAAKCSNKWRGIWHTASPLVCVLGQFVDLAVRYCLSLLVLFQIEKCNECLALLLGWRVSAHTLPTKHTEYLPLAVTIQTIYTEFIHSLHFYVPLFWESIWCKQASNKVAHFFCVIRVALYF